MLTWNNVLGAVFVGLVATGCGTGEQSTEIVRAEIDQGEFSTAAPIDTPTAAVEAKLKTVNVHYLPDGSTNQVLDVFLPRDFDGPYPTVLMIHGGGFISGSKSIYVPLAGELTKAGIAAVTVNYRKAPRFNYPSPVEDIFCSLAWIYENHEAYGFDTHHIFVWGGSAGAYLAALMAATDDPSVYLASCPYSVPDSDWLQGAIALYGFYTFESMEGLRPLDVKSQIEPFIGMEYEMLSAELIRELSPSMLVDGSEPPFLLIHGTDDTIVSSLLAEDFARILQDHGVNVDLLLIPGAVHGFEEDDPSKPAISQALEAAITFIYSLID